MRIRYVSLYERRLPLHGAGPGIGQQAPAVLQLTAQTADVTFVDVTTGCRCEQLCLLRCHTVRIGVTTIAILRRQFIGQSRLQPCEAVQDVSTATWKRI